MTDTRMRQRRQHGDETHPVLTIAVALAALQLLIGALTAPLPSYWADEAATLSVTQRPFPDMWQLLTTVDAVHGIYYAIQCAFMSVSGTDPGAARILPALASALTVGGVVVLGSRLFSLPAGVFAGGIAILLPGLAWTATELRSYSLTAFAAVATILTLEAATRRNTPARWVAYCLTLTFTVWVFLFSALIVIPAGLLALHRRRFRPWLWATAAAGLASVPVVALTVGQSAQVAWIQNDLGRMVQSAAVGQYFFGQRSTEWAGGGFIGVTPSVLGLMAVLLTVFTSLVLCWFTFRETRSGRISGPVMLAGWVIAPTMILIAVTLLGKPVYLERYTTFTAPGLCLWLGAALAAMPRRAGVVALVVFSLVAAPILVTQKTEGSKPDNYAAVAGFVEERKEPRAAAVYSDIRAQGVAAAYREQFAGVEDVALAGSAVETNSFWGSNISADDLNVARLSGRQVFVFTMTAYPTGFPAAGDPYDAVLMDQYLVRLVGAGCVVTEAELVSTITVYVLNC